jgi:peptidoglycan hydrolase-like protein with peptidoglycan-binding domain
MDKIVKKGSRGDEVRALQGKLNKLGYDVKNDGIFGDDTERAVLNLQTAFGYNVDGVVGTATWKLVDQQLALGWNSKTPSATSATPAGTAKASGGASDKSMGSTGKAPQSPDAKKI